MERRRRWRGLAVFTLPDVCLQVSNHQWAHSKMPILRGGKPKTGEDLSIRKRKTKSKGVFDGIRVKRQTQGRKSREALSFLFLWDHRARFVHLVICWYKNHIFWQVIIALQSLSYRLLPIAVSLKAPLGIVVRLYLNSINPNHVSGHEQIVFMQQGGKKGAK